METSRRKWLQAIGTSTVALGTGATVISAQQEDDGAETETQQGALRVAHYSDNATTVDISLDDEEIQTGVSYASVTDYMSVAAGDHTIQITGTEDGSMVFQGDVTVEANRAYTAAATGSGGDEGTQVTVLSDYPIAAVRLLHAVSGAEGVDVLTGDEQAQTVLFENAQFGETSDYVQVPAGTTTVSLRPTDGDGTGEPLAQTDLDLAPGGSYTVVARGMGEEDMAATEDGETATETEDGETATETEDGATATEMGGDAVAIETVPDVETANADILSLFASGGETDEEETETEEEETETETEEEETETETEAEETETETEAETETETETGTETPTETEGMDDAGTNDTATGGNETATGGNETVTGGNETATGTATETPNGG
jgi:hypothetical protein